MPTYTFEKVTWPASKRLPCPDCGKKVKRSTTFMQTLNPFNKTEGGQIKDRSQIWKELRAEAEVWEQEPVPCTGCGERT